MVFYLRVPKHVLLTDTNLHRLYLVLTLLVWFTAIFKFWWLDEAYAQHSLSEHAGVYLKEWGFEDPRRMNEALERDVCRHPEAFDFGEDFQNNTCMRVCPEGVSDDHCYLAFDARLYAGRDVAWFPTHYHRKYMGLNGFKSAPKNYILPFVEDMGFTFELKWKITPQKSFGGQSTIFFPYTEKLVRNGDWRENIVLVVLLYDDDGVPTKMLEFEPTGTPEYVINFTVPQILALAGAPDALYDFQYELAEAGKGPPRGRVSGFEILLDVRCSNRKHRVIPSSVDLDSDASAYRTHYCAMQVIRHERWIYLWDTDVQTATELTSYELYHGVRIGTKTDIVVELVSMDNFYLFLIGFLVIIKIPVTLVVFFIEHFLGRWSVIYYQVINERFSILRSVSSMSTRLMMYSYVLEQLKHGLPELTKDTIARYITRALDTHDHKLEGNERSNVVDFVYSSMVFYRRQGKETTTAAVKSLLFRHPGKILRDDTLRIRPEIFIASLAAQEHIHFYQFIGLFNRHSKLTLGERFVCPAEIRDCVYNTDNGARSGPPVAVSLCGKPAEALTMGDNGAADKEAVTERKAVDQMRDGETRQAEGFQEQLDALRSDMKRQAEAFQEQLDALRLELGGSGKGHPRSFGNGASAATPRDGAVLPQPLVTAATNVAVTIAPGDDELSQQRLQGLERSVQRLDVGASAIDVRMRILEQMVTEAIAELKMGSFSEQPISDGQEQGPSALPSRVPSCLDEKPLSLPRSTSVASSVSGDRSIGSLWRVQAQVLHRVSDLELVVNTSWASLVAQEPERFYGLLSQAAEDQGAAAHTSSGAEPQGPGEPRPAVGGPDH